MVALEHEKRASTTGCRTFAASGKQSKFLRAVRNVSGRFGVSGWGAGQGGWPAQRDEPEGAIGFGSGYLESVGGKVTTHTLRHTFVRLVQAGVSLAKVSKVLGQSSVTTMEIYAHLAPNEISEEATNVLNGTSISVGMRRYWKRRRRELGFGLMLC
jgi:hypothetical protein